MFVRKLRLQRGWSQEQLAELSGLSVRTIQRLERGQRIGLESLKSLAAVLEIDLMALHEDDAMIQEPRLTLEEQRVIEQVRDIKGFYSHAVLYVAVVSLLILLNLVGPYDYFWALWPALGWGIGLAYHGICVFEVSSFFGAEWEKRQIERRLGRKL